MILSGNEIERRLGKDIVITPFQSSRLNPNSYNVSLHPSLYTYQVNELDPKQDIPLVMHKIPEEGYWLQPGILYLGRTDEYTETRDLVPMLEGRSSVGRLGVFIHVTAGFGDVGFCGYWTLEIAVIQPVKIYPHLEIGQLYYHTIEGSYVAYHSDKYHNNQGVQSSQLWKELNR
jgi:dCTP deaminase